MTTSREPDDIIQAWLDEGPRTLPAVTARAIEVATRDAPQRRSAGPSWKEIVRMMTAAKPLAGAVTVLAAVVLGGALLSGLINEAGPSGATDAPSPQPPPTASPTPTVAATPSPTSSPTPSLATFTSPLYGYTVAHPPAWRPTPATDRWPVGGPVGPVETYVDHFAAPPSGTGVTFVGIAAQALPDGMDAAAWMADYAERLEAGDRPCSGPAADWTDITVAGGPGRRLLAACDPEEIAEVVFVVGATGYVMTGQPSVVDRMLDSFQPG